jgi:hypothetical protein
MAVTGNSMTGTAIEKGWSTGQSVYSAIVHEMGMAALPPRVPDLRDPRAARWRQEAPWHGFFHGLEIVCLRRLSFESRARAARVHRIQLIDELPGAGGDVRGWLSMERFCAAFIANISWAFPGWLI